VCVTGCTGFIASHVVRLLLDRGYTVHGTVRSVSDPARSEHVTGLPGADARLRLFEADLLKPGSFDAAMAGCTAVLHMASPFFTKADDPHAELIQPAVQGTRNVLASAARTASVRAVVSTSSAASVYVTRKPADHFYTEDDWSDLEYVRETKQHYVESKLLAELEAGRFLREEPAPARAGGPLRLVTICPTSTIGPLMQPYVNTSSSYILELMNGAKAKIPNRCKCFVDVRCVVCNQQFSYVAQRFVFGSPRTVSASAARHAPEARKQARKRTTVWCLVYACVARVIVGGTA
jgi:nucleoside-diphosphate-sugar epimerase